MAGRSIEEIEELIEAQRYDAGIVPQLESFITDPDAPYSSDACLCLLKLYQFHPNVVNSQARGKALLRALMQMPKADYVACLCLIPESDHADSFVATIVSLAECLETCRFQDFWAQASLHRTFLDGVCGFDDAIREFMLGVVTMTYQTISKDVLSACLHLAPAEIDQLAQRHGWVVKDERISFPVTDDNQAKAKTVVDDVTFEQVSRIISSVSSK